MNFLKNISKEFYCEAFSEDKVGGIYFDEFILKIREAEGQYILNIKEAKEMIKEKNEETVIYENEITLDVQKLKEISLFANRDKDSFSILLKYVSIQIENNKMEIASTDGHRLLVSTSNIEKEDMEFRIPENIVQILSKLKLKSELFKIKYFESTFEITIGTLIISYERLYKSYNKTLEYPKYMSVVPDVECNHYNVELPIEKIKEIIPTIKTFISINKDNAYLYIENNKFYTLSNYGLEDEVTIELGECILCDENKEIEPTYYAFQLKFILEFFNYILNCKPKSVPTLYINQFNPAKPALIKFDNELILIMPFIF